MLKPEAFSSSEVDTGFVKQNKDHKATSHCTGRMAFRRLNPKTEATEETSERRIQLLLRYLLEKDPRIRAHQTPVTLLSLQLLVPIHLNGT